MTWGSGELDLNSVCQDEALEKNLPFLGCSLLSVILQKAQGPEVGPWPLASGSVPDHTPATLGQ